MSGVSGTRIAVLIILCGVAACGIFFALPRATQSQSLLVSSSPSLTLATEARGLPPTGGLPLAASTWTSDLIKLISNDDQFHVRSFHFHSDWDGLSREASRVLDDVVAARLQSATASPIRICDIGGDSTPMWLPSIYSGGGATRIGSILSLVSLPGAAPQCPPSRRKVVEDAYCRQLLEVGKKAFGTHTAARLSCQGSLDSREQDVPITDDLREQGPTTVLVQSGVLASEIMRAWNRLIVGSSKRTGTENSSTTATARDGYCDVMVFSRAQNDKTADSLAELMRVKMFLKDNGTLLIPKKAKKYIDIVQGTSLSFETARATGTEFFEQFTHHRKPLLPHVDIDNALATFASVNLTGFEAIAKVLAAKASQLEKRPEGHSSELISERQMYMALARMPHVKRICEIGFNAGHSAALWLWANPTVEVVMFDLWFHKYTPVNFDFLNSDAAAAMGLKNVRKRLTVHRGSSFDTVPKYADAMQCSASNREKCCDIVSVDGDHSFQSALKDLDNMKRLANPLQHIALIDDSNGDHDWMRPVDRATNEYESVSRKMKSIIRMAEYYVQNEYWRGLTVFQYAS